MRIIQNIQHRRTVNVFVNYVKAVKYATIAKETSIAKNAEEKHYANMIKISDIVKNAGEKHYANITKIGDIVNNAEEIIMQT